MEATHVKQVNVGFVGCGYMGQIAHLANFATDPRCRIVALADLRQNLAKKVAQKYSIPKVYENHEHLLKDAEIEAVVEITQDDSHAPIAIDAMNAGKHVYTEKPLTTNLEDAQRMVSTAKRKGVKLMVSYMKRYDPGVDVAKNEIAKALQDGSMGSLTFARSHGFGGNWVCNVGKPITTDEPGPSVNRVNPSWLPEELVNDYRTYLNVYCHNINLLRYLIGDPESARFCSYHAGSKVLLMEYKDFPAIVETGWLSAHFWDENTEVYLRDGRFRILTPPPLLRNVPADVEIYRAGSVQTYTRPAAGWDWSFRRSAEHFIDCILNDKTPISSGEDSMVDIRIVEEAFKRIPD